jgi:hypothetical protein
VDLSKPVLELLSQLQHGWTATPTVAMTLSSLPEVTFGADNLLNLWKGHIKLASKEGSISHTKSRKLPPVDEETPCQFRVRSEA